MGFFTHTTRQFSDTSWIAYNEITSDTIYLEIVSVLKDSVLQKCPPTPTSDANYMSRWSPVLLTYQL